MNHDCQQHTCAFHGEHQSAMIGKTQTTSLRKDLVDYSPEQLAEIDKESLRVAYIMTDRPAVNGWTPFGTEPCLFWRAIPETRGDIFGPYKKIVWQTAGGTPLAETIL